MYLMHQYLQCIDVFQDYNGLQWFYDVGLFPKYTHLEYGVFFKTIILFVFSYGGFNFCFWQPVHFHFNLSKKPVSRLDN